MKQTLLFASLLPWSLAAQPDSTQRWNHTHYSIEAEAIASKGQHNPFWFSANRYGLNSIAPQQHMLRLSLIRDEASDSARTWKLGYGADVVTGTHQLSPVHIQQLYASLRYGHSRFTLGMKEQASYLVHPTLSTGSQSFGMNARPLPEVRWDLEWTNISGAGHWAAIRGHAAYGIVTDGAWQKEYASPYQNYVKGTILHHKAGFLRLGNPDRHTFNFTMGIEMAREFGGTVHFGQGEKHGTPRQTQEMASDALQYLFAFIGTGGYDTVVKTQYANNGGNTVGSWRFALDYRNRRYGWAARLYYDHFFEDHSAMFDEYGWFDGMWGLQVDFPKNHFISSIVLEHLRTDDQSGPLYHDHTAVVPDQISARDNYYNHGLFQGWQHFGMARGNALYASPMYEDKGTLIFSGNRFRANHIGITGQPLSKFSYRLLYSHLWSWGTYNVPYEEVRHQHSALLELGYTWRSWTAKVGLAFDRGDKIGQQSACQITIAKRGRLF